MTEREQKEVKKTVLQSGRMIKGCNTSCVTSYAVPNYREKGLFGYELSERIRVYEICKTECDR